MTDTPISIDELELSVRSYNCLTQEWGMNIRTVEELCSYSAAELLRCPHFGRKSLKEVEDILAFHGRKLAPSGWPKDVKLLKCHEPYFTDILVGRKTFELRKNDRDYKVGDILHLHSTSTDRHCYVKVLYVLEGGQFGLEDGYVAMSIRRE